MFALYWKGLCCGMENVIDVYLMHLYMHVFCLNSELREQSLFIWKSMAKMCAAISHDRTLDQTSPMRADPLG